MLNDDLQDVLVYGAPLLRNLSNRQGPLVLLPASLWDLLHLSRKEYVDFALLLGTDFSQRIKNVGLQIFNFCKDSVSVTFSKGRGTLEGYLQQ